MNTNNLPPLPEPFIVLDHTPGAKLAWGAQMREYGQLCRQQMREEAAKVCDAEFWRATKRYGSLAAVAAANCEEAIRSIK